MRSVSAPEAFTLVTVHGNGGGGFRFARLVDHLPPTVTIFSPTLPGFASQPPNPAFTTVQHYADHLVSIVAHLPRPRVLLGTGIGGAFVLDAAQRHAAEIDALILHAPVGTRLDQRLFPRVMRLPFMRALGQWAFSSVLFRPVFRRLLFHTPLPAAVEQRFFDEYRRCRVFSQMFDIITPGWWASLRPVALPTALLWGERERILSVDQLNDYKALLPHHLVRTVPNWDHFPMLEQPAEYAAEVLALARQLLAHPETA